MQFRFRVVTFLNVFLIVDVICNFKYDPASITIAEEESIANFFRTLLPMGPKNLMNHHVSRHANSKLFSNSFSEMEDTHLSIEELIRKYGFSVEKFEVITEDGFILTLFRIPSSKLGPPIFLMHGLLMSADDWVTPGPQSGIAYLLAAEGFDVWLGNARGCKHSRRHNHLSPKSDEFWDFSWDEIGRYDLPAMIDFVLNTTHQPKLIYVGHSQGTTSFFVMGSEKPEYNNKISLMVALAPTGAIPHLKSPFLLFINYATLMHSEILFAMMRKAGLNEFAPKDGVVQKFAKAVCGNDEFARAVCSNVVFLICGFSYSQLNVTNLPVLFSHSMSGASTKQLEHYAQTVSFRKFQRFDYGKIKNKVLYGSSTPPEYNVEKITAPLALFYSANDWLATEPDVQNLRSKLKNVIDVYKVPHKTFNHLDFLFAKDIRRLIFQRLLKLIKKTI